MYFSKGSSALILLTISSYIGLFECAYFSLGRRCLYGDCSEYSSYPTVYNKPIYANSKPAYFKPSYVSPSTYVQPSYRIRYPQYVRNNFYQQPRRYIRPIRPENPGYDYEIVQIAPQPEPLSNLAYYPVEVPQHVPINAHQGYNSIEGAGPSRIVDALTNGEREEVVIRPKPSYEEDPDNEVEIGAWERVERPYNNGRMQDAKSLDPTTCVKHEDCTKFCNKTVNSIGVFGSCYNGSCRCGIRS